MRALTMWQPWASLLVRGVKRVETRGWDTRHRGWLLVHAAQRRMDAEELEQISGGCRALGLPEPGFKGLPYGALVGAVWLDNTWQFESERGDPFGDWTPGRYGWRCTHGVEFSTPIRYAATGRTLWQVPEYVAQPLYWQLRPANYTWSER